MRYLCLLTSMTLLAVASTAQAQTREFARRKLPDVAPVSPSTKAAAVKTFKDQPYVVKPAGRPDSIFLGTTRLSGTAWRLQPKLALGRFDATRFGDTLVFFLGVSVDGPVDYHGGRSYVIEEMLPGGGSRMIGSGKVGPMPGGHYTAFSVRVADPRAPRTYLARLVPGDTTPADDVKTFVRP